MKVQNQKATDALLCTGDALRIVRAWIDDFFLADELSPSI